MYDINGISFPFSITKKSKMWPSDDPADQFETLSCDVCKWSRAVQVYGNFSIDEHPHGFEKAVEMGMFHVERCCPDNIHSAEAGRAKEKELVDAV